MKVFSLGPKQLLIKHDVYFMSNDLHTSRVHFHDHHFIQHNLFLKGVSSYQISLYLSLSVLSAHVNLSKHVTCDARQSSRDLTTQSLMEYSPTLFLIHLRLHRMHCRFRVLYLSLSIPDTHQNQPFVVHVRQGICSLQYSNYSAWWDIFIHILQV